MYQRLKPYLLNAGILTFLLVILAFVIQLAPFGKYSLLTIDLGQQYIDFFSLFKNTLLENPEQVFYSFEKGMGGEMVGLWAYYLTSPFNLLLLLFSDPHLVHAVTLLTYVKLLAMSVTMMYFVKEKFQAATPLAIMASHSYTLMSYAMVFLLNIMWLDGMIWLPLIALGLDRLIQSKRPTLYVVGLALALMANYYIGFMICLFLSFYALFAIVSLETRRNWKVILCHYLSFVMHSLLAVSIAAIVLVPTFTALLSSKASHMDYDFDWATAHNVLDVLSKSFIGSYNDAEMSSGSPNIYVGTLMGILSLAYFLTKEIKPLEKWVAGGVLAIFMASFYFETLDRIWHGGQFPIWYHFRFSFTWGFFVIVLALHAYPYLRQTFRGWRLATITAVQLILTLIFIVFMDDYEFLNQWKILGSCLMGVIFLWILTSHKWNLQEKQILLLPLVFLELMANAGIILGQINYVQVSKFDDYVRTLDQSLEGLRSDDKDFYRIHTTFQRTKNEAFFTHYNGLDHFGSTIEATVRDFYGYLGLPSGGGFVNYSNGTLMSDGLFNVKYLIDPTFDTRDHTLDHEYVLFQQAEDMDIDAYPLINQKDRYQIHENSHRLGLGFEVSDDVLKDEVFFEDHSPITNQELLLDLIDFKQEYGDFYHTHDFKEVVLHNVEAKELSTLGYTDYTSTLAEDAGEQEISRIRYYYDVPTANPYYFTLPSQLTSKKSDLKLNNKPYKAYMPYQKRQITNASYGLIKNDQFLDIILKEESLKINPPTLHEFDEDAYDQLMADHQKNNLQVTSFTHTKIQGAIDVQQDQGAVLFTIPFDSNWTVKVDGQPVDTHSVLSDTLLAIPIDKGSHEIELTFFPKAVRPGALLSLLGVTGLVIVRRVRSLED